MGVVLGRVEKRERELEKIKRQYVSIHLQRKVKAPSRKVAIA